MKYRNFILSPVEKTYPENGQFPEVIGRIALKSPITACPQKISARTNKAKVPFSRH